MFSKIWQILGNHFKTGTARITTGYDFRKNKEVLLMLLENLNCPYYHELKFSQK